jgi:hypothetical protein
MKRMVLILTLVTLLATLQRRTAGRNEADLSLVATDIAFDNERASTSRCD